MIEANFYCLFCLASYHRPRHRCIRECQISGDGVLHFDICAKCADILTKSFVRQLAKLPRLRVEGGRP